MIDNAVIHYYPLSPFIAKVGVNVREGDQIVFRAALKDEAAAVRFLQKWPEIKVKTIVHC